MSKVSITKAWKLSGIKSRTTFYEEYVNTGVLVVDRTKPNKPEVDTAEIIRVFGKLQNPDSSGQIGQKLEALQQQNDFLQRLLDERQERIRNLEDVQKETALQRDNYKEWAETMQAQANNRLTTSDKPKKGWLEKIKDIFR